MRTQINDSVCCHLGHYTIKILIDWLIDSGSDLPGVGGSTLPMIFLTPSLRRFELLGVDGAENVAFSMIFPSATAALWP